MAIGLGLRLGLVARASGYRARAIGLGLVARARARAIGLGLVAKASNYVG